MKTIYKAVTEAWEYEFFKHEKACRETPDVDAYIDMYLDRMSRQEFLRAISDAIEERLR